MPETNPSPRAEPELEGDYRPVDPAASGAHLDPANIRVEAADVAYLMQDFGDNLIRCYEELVRLNLVGQEEIPLVKAWVQDIAQPC